MPNIRTKLVTWRELKKGMTVESVRSGARTSYAKYTVESANMSTVVLLQWGTNRMEFNAEETMFEIEIPREEFEKKYEEKAKTLMKALQNEMAEYEIGHHCMDNTWIRYDPYEMAAIVAERELTVLGVCTSIPPKDRSADTGICVEEKDGTRFWCHACSVHIESMFYWNPSLH